MSNNSKTDEKIKDLRSLNNTKSKKADVHTKRGMYSSVAIKGFRLFDQIELDDLARVNLFFGPNNSGRTSILEAIYTHACGLNFSPFLGQVLLRRQDGALGGPMDFGDKLISLFRDTSSPPYTFVISAKVTGDSATHKVTARFHPSSELSHLDPRALGQFSGSFPSEPQTDAQYSLDLPQVRGQQVQMYPIKIQPVFMGKWQIQLNKEKRDFDLNFPPSSGLSASPFKLANMHDLLSHRTPKSDIKVFSYLKRYGVLSEFIDEMKQVFEEICEIDMIPYPDGTQGAVYVVISDSRQIPLYAFGDGMRRWFHLLGHMLVNQNAIHCLEEIDATFHPDSYRNLSCNLIQYAEKYNNQLFVTSHNIEFADAFLDSLYGENGVVAPDKEDPVRVFTIKQDDAGQIEVWPLTGRKAYESRRDYELEVR